MIAPLRGQVFRVDLGYGAKPWLVVSNNQRNRHLDTVLAARVTTTGEHIHIPTVIPLSHDDPLAGRVICDDLVQLYRDDDLARAPLLGVLSPATMRAVSLALRVVLP
ncbi:MAG: MazF family transcriptional regulator [Pseudonocardiales bacterium]|nr:MazF family transcriptional regulator [Pseudonocardiales bacterium]